MFNALRNNFTRITSNKEKLTLINQFTKNFSNTKNKNLFTKLSNFNFMTLNNPIITNQNKQKPQAPKELSFTRLKFQKIISHKFTTAKTEDSEEVHDEKTGREPKVDECPEFYENLIEEVSQSPNLNEDEKAALIEKLKSFFNSHLELNEERKKQHWGKVYNNIVKRLRKEDDEVYKEEFLELYENYKYNKKKQRRIRKFIYKRIFKRLLLMILVILGFNIYYNIKEINDSENNILYVSKIDDMINWICKTYRLIEKKLSNPYHSKLLPTQIILPGQPLKKTLVINLESTLIDYDYHIGSGAECKTRPYIQKFFDELTPYYEIVVFSNISDSHFVEKVVNELNKTGNNVSHMLGTEALARYEGKHIKDLNFLNRDLKNVIAIDFKEEYVIKHKNNLILLPPFNGEENDTEFRNIIPFLKEMAKKEVTDVRDEIEKYGNFKPYLNYYRSNPKYRALLPKEEREKKQ